MKPEGWLRGQEKPVVSCGETVDLHMNVEVPEAFAEPVAVIVGVRGLGEVLFDDRGLEMALAVIPAEIRDERQ